MLPDPSDLLGMLIFSIIGLIAFRSGKREAQIPKLVIGMALMLYPYFISSGLWLWVTGAGLTVSLFLFRE